MIPDYMEPMLVAVVVGLVLVLMLVTTLNRRNRDDRVLLRAALIGMIEPYVWWRPWPNNGDGNARMCSACQVTINPADLDLTRHTSMSDGTPCPVAYAYRALARTDRRK